MRRILAQARSEAGKPIGRRLGRQGERQDEAERRRALGGEIGEIDAQRFARNVAGRIIGEKMHPGDDGIRRDDDVMTRERRENRRIVPQTEPCRPGDRRKIGRDQIVFRKLAGIHLSRRVFA